MDGCHPLIRQEIALGAIRQRDAVLSSFADLSQFPTISHSEVMHLVEQRRLWGRGLSAVDAHLLAAVRVVPGAQLWTRDKRLKAACGDVEVREFVGG